MTQSTLVETDGDAAIVVKRATGDSAARLRAEGERLRLAAHPGVVELLSSTGSDDAWELRMVHGGRALEAIRGLSVDQVAGVLAALASTLADLHALGIVHGRIQSAHVLLGCDGRPRVCGLGPGDDGRTASDDVAALGSLAVALLGDGTEMEPIPDHRWWPRRQTHGDWERRTLLLLADQACADPPSRRPTAARFAAAVADAVPGATPIGGPPPVPKASDPFARLRPAGEEPARREIRRPAALAGVVLGVLMVGAGALRAVRVPAERPAIRATQPTGTEVTVVTPTSTSRVERALLPSTTEAPASLPPCVVLPGAAAGSCAQPVWVAGTTVVVGERRFEVGLPGDQVVVADWDCDGNATPAVLRPATGEVYLFSTWPATADVVEEPFGWALGASELTAADPDADGCSSPVALRSDGSVVRLAPRSAT